MNLLLILQYRIPTTPIPAIAITNHTENIMNVSGFMSPIIAPINKGVPKIKNKKE